MQQQSRTLETLLRFVVEHPGGKFRRDWGVGFRLRGRARRCHLGLLLLALRDALEISGVEHELGRAPHPLHIFEFRELGHQRVMVLTARMEIGHSPR
mgnify:FL=1